MLQLHTEIIEHPKSWELLVICIVEKKLLKFLPFLLILVISLGGLFIS